ncbi:hypothetical protein GGX14DRAFT_563939 [Mycena pura]|uniref:Uncharacterized protein n=1 Tax=Mycena pura TaxID=153505 RepID=A0AAD6VLT5_9AGAR|nr:hypothetical protein GGX14DRAFT_563939 [Mycena pura]
MQLSRIAAERYESAVNVLTTYIVLPKRPAHCPGHLPPGARRPPHSPLHAVLPARPPPTALPATRRALCQSAACRSPCSLPATRRSPHAPTAHRALRLPSCRPPHSPLPATLPARPLPTARQSEAADDHKRM